MENQEARKLLGKYYRHVRTCDCGRLYGSDNKKDNKRCRPCQAKYSNSKKKIIVGRIELE